RGITYYDKVPGLQVGSARRRGRSAQAMIDDLAGDGPRREGAHTAPPLHVGAKGSRPLEHLLHGILPIGAERDQARWSHGQALELRGVHFSALHKYAFWTSITGHGAV